MKQKNIKAILIGLAIFALMIPVSAKQTEPASDLPEQEGVYAVPGRPDLKLRVFVYKVKQDKPGKPGPITPAEDCTLADPDSNVIVPGAGWKLSGPWTYHLNPTSVPATVGSANLKDIATNAFNVWSNAINGKIGITRGADTLVSRAQLDGQNIITWGRTSGSALAVSYIWYKQGIATEVDTIMNNSFTWYWSNPNSWSGQVCAYSGVYDAQNILTHELGHTFGLNDRYTSDYQNNTMYGYGSKTETKKDTLTAGDITGVQALY